DVGPRLHEQRAHRPARAIEHRQQDMRGLDELMIAAERERLRVGQRLLKAAGQFVHAHESSTLGCDTWVGQRVCGDKPLSVQGAAVPKIAYAEARGLARKAPQLSRGAVPEVEQWTDEFLIVAPALNRTLIDLLPHLPEAGCRHGSDSLVEIQAPLIPRE